MYRFFKFILGTGLVVTSLWSCSLDDAAPVLSINAVDPIPMAKEFYTQEKPKQVSSSFRIQAEQEIFPFLGRSQKPCRWANPDRASTPKGTGEVRSRVSATICL